MSEEVAAAVETTADVATEVYESLESPEPVAEATAPAETSTETATVETPAATPAVVQPAPTDAEKLLHAEGFTVPRRDDGRENRIPYSKVVKIIENGINQGKGQFGEKYKAVEAERDTYRADLDEMYTDLRGDPWAFVEKIAQHDPRYSDIVKLRNQPAT